jgi:hypothetical protein
MKWRTIGWLGWRGSWRRDGGGEELAEFKRLRAESASIGKIYQRFSAT